MQGHHRYERVRGCVMVIFIKYVLEASRTRFLIPHCILPSLLTANSLFSPSCHSTPPPPIPTLSPLTHRHTSGLRKGKGQELPRPVKNVHTLLSLFHTHTHTPRPSAAVVLHAPPAPSSETLNEDRNNDRTSIAFSSYHRYWRIYLIVHITQLFEYLFKHPIVKYST
jgi:hypothetical protein